MIVLTVLSAVAEGPAPEDVKAGWVALLIFLLLGLAVAFLGWSLTKHLRKAQEAKDLGVYGDEPPTSPGSGDDGSASGAAQQGDQRSE